MDTCKFCDIITGITPAAIYFEDNETLVIKDIRPVNEFHFLAIPKYHIATELDLKPGHKKLVKRLIRNGKRVMSQMGADMDDILYGFHRPPFLTVHHLHMHFVSPKRNLYFDEHLYQFNTRYFISAGDVLVRLGDKRIRRVRTQDTYEEEEEEQINCCVII